MQPLTQHVAATGTDQGSFGQYRSFGYVASSKKCYGLADAQAATLVGAVRSTPDQDKLLRDRLEEAVRRFAGGSADKFGQLIGYANGGYVREVLNNKKPVRRRLIERIHARPEMVNWFGASLSPISASDVMPADRYTADIIEILPRLTAEDRRRLAALLANIVGSGLSLSAFADMLSEPAVEPIAGLLPGMSSPGASDRTAARPASPIAQKPSGLPHL